MFVGPGDCEGKSVDVGETAGGASVMVCRQLLAQLEVKVRDQEIRVLLRRDTMW